MRLPIYFLRSFLFITLLFVGSIFAQTTAITYQGRFNDSSVPSPTNGTYEMQFKAFAAVSAGGQTGLTITNPTVQVVNGIFTVQLDFGATVFNGLDVFLETSVRPTGSSAAFSTLAPRQQVTSAPLAIQSLNAGFARDASLFGGLLPSFYTLSNDSRLADDRNPTAGSANYVQNQNTTPQVSTNFNISGNGSANLFNSATQFNIAGNRVLSVQGSLNLFAGVSAGTANTGGNSNTFIGNFSGNANTNGFNNAFVGTDSGRNNQANNNSFFGRSSGFANIGGTNNSFFGLDAGRFNLSGNNNAFFGYGSGANTLSNGNSFFGFQAGSSNTIGDNNTIIGSGANVGSNNLTLATAIGANAIVNTSNTVVLGTATTSTEVPGTFKVFTLGAAGGTSLCRNAANQIATCTGGAGGNFIQNSTVLQPSSDFNISGGGTLGGTLSANVVNSTTNFRIGNLPVFSTPNSTSVVIGQSSNHALVGSNSTFIGFKSGAASNSFSQANTFIGSNAGTINTGGGNNSFVGKDAGLFNSTGSFNSFFGGSAGVTNTTADANSFFGYESGLVNSIGTRNSFFGFQSGRASTVNDNSFFGYQAGTVTTGNANSFFGSSAGNTTTNGSANSLFGSSTTTSGSENVVVGTGGNANGSKNTVVGEDANSQGSGNTVIGNFAVSTGNNNTNIGNGTSNVLGDFNTTIGYQASVKQFPGASGPVNNSTAIGAGAVVDSSNTIVLGTNQEFVKIPGNLNVSGNAFANQISASTIVVTGGTLKLTVVASPTNTGNHLLCINGNNLVARCLNSTSNDNLANPSDDNSQSSSKQQKVEEEKQSAQINAQQTQINLQVEKLKQQQETIDALKKLVCVSNPTAAVCQK